MEALLNYFETIPSSHRSLILVGGLTLFWLIEGGIPLFNFKYNKWKHALPNLFFRHMEGAEYKYWISRLNEILEYYEGDEFALDDEFSMACLALLRMAASLAQSQFFNSVSFI